MDATLWWLFISVTTLASLTPGPAVLTVVGTALQSGMQRSAWATAGILSANVIWFAISATTLGALLLASSYLFIWMKWIGAAYLLYLGVRSWRAESNALLPVNRAVQGSSFGGAFLVQMTNPKALVYLTGVLPPFLDSRYPIGPQILALAIIGTVIECTVLVGYGFAAGKAAALVAHPRYATWVRRIAGSVLILAGVGVALLRRE
jgi:threonine/homoserine/homoserine lactone efflux protein